MENTLIYSRSSTGLYIFSRPSRQRDLRLSMIRALGSLRSDKLEQILPVQGVSPVVGWACDNCPPL